MDNRQSFNFKNETFMRWMILVAAPVILGVVIGFNLYSDRRQILQEEENRILTQTRVIARNMEYHFKTTNIVLQGILDDLPFLLKPQNRAQAGVRLRTLVKAMPGVRLILFTDSSGTVLNATNAELIGRNFKNRHYFTQPLTHPDPLQLYISPPFKTFTNTYTFTLSRMITGTDGRFAGVVVASVEPKYFGVLLESVLYAPDMIVTINDGRGIRFMIHPPREGQAGKNLAVPGSMFSRHKQSGKEENVYIDKGYATGEYRMMALITLSRRQVGMDEPPCIIAGRKMSEILRSWRRNAAMQGIFFLLACVALTVVVWLVQKRQDAAFLAEQALAESRRRFSDIFDFMPDATLVVDIDKRVIGWNRAMEQMSGVSKEDMMGQGDYAYTVPFYGERRPNLIDALFADDESLANLYNDLSRQGTTVFAETFCPALYNGKGAHIWAMAAPLYDLNGVMTGVIESIRDISAAKQLQTELKKSNELLASQARIDFLTGIYNRMMFSELLDAQLSVACRYQTPIAVIMFDIDHFKRINDTMGHNTGDYVLKESARLVSSRLRAHDVFCRWGGEEFLVLAPKNDAAQATQLAEILRELIAEHDFGEGLHVTISFGVVCHVCGETSEALIERADAAMYQAKSSGRNRVFTA